MYMVPKEKYMLLKVNFCFNSTTKKPKVILSGILIVSLCSYKGGAHVLRRCMNVRYIYEAAPPLRLLSTSWKPVKCIQGPIVYINDYS